MELALAEAAKATARGEVPVGAVVVHGETVLGLAGNRTRADADPTAHAEIIALRAAAASRGKARLDGCDLYVTLEPCPMCAHAISLAHIRRLVFGAYDAKGGGVEHGPQIYRQSTCHHRPEVVGGVRENDAGRLLTAFFREKR